MPARNYKVARGQSCRRRAPYAQASAYGATGPAHIHGSCTEFSACLDRAAGTPLGAVPSPPPWWLGRLSTVPATGLTTFEADARLRQRGPNSPPQDSTQPLARQLWRRLRNSLNLILLAASAVSAATGDVTNFAIIVFMVVLSVALDFVQEHRATRAAAKRRASLALRAKIVRDGVETDLPVDAVVPGDVVLLCAGDRVPADARVLQAPDFFVNQGC